MIMIFFHVMHNILTKANSTWTHLDEGKQYLDEDEEVLSTD